MLKSNEVRIGNDVLYMDTDTPEFVRIKIEKADIILLCEGIQGYNYKGVPLTKQIVSTIKCIKNFDVNYTGGIISINTQTHLVIREFMGTWNIYVRCHHERVAEYLDVKLHQLQNLVYSLNGTELEMV